MIEVTCGACGSTLRFAEADVPPGGKTVTCTQCKARVALPNRIATAKLPSIPAPGAAGGTGDVINLSDLPAPKRPSPLAGASSSSGGTKTSPMQAVLPPKPSVPSVPSVPATPTIPAPPKPVAAPTPSMRPEIQMDGIDLDALDLGPPPGDSDLPAPKRPAGPRSAPKDLSDLPAPKGPPAKTSVAKPPVSRPSDSDLPAPKRPSGPRSVPKDLSDLPAPKGPPAAKPATPRPTDAELPAPKRPSPRNDLLDLPAPKPGAPPSADDLLAPKGFFDDLPAPKGASRSARIEDEISLGDLPVPVGPSSSSDLPAPKGFFDDLPAAASPKPTRAPAPTPEPMPEPMLDPPPPKGFFDDLPAKTGRDDDIPGPTLSPPKSTSKGLDLDDLDLAPPTQPPRKPVAAPPPATAAPARAKPPAISLDDVPPPPAPPAASPMGPRATPLELDAGDDVPALELDVPGDRFDSLDLPAAPAGPSAPTKAPGGVVSFKPSQPAPAVISSGPPPREALGLDLDVDDSRTPKASARSGALAAEPGPRASAKTAAAKPSKARLRMILLVAALVVVGGGTGGFFYYQRWKKQEAQRAQQASSLASARRALAGDGPRHWADAAAAAERVLADDPGHRDALAIAAIADLAGYLDEGTDEKRRVPRGEKHVEQLRSAAASGPIVDKAFGLYALVTGDAAGAVKTLGALADRQPKDADAQLFLGWAHAAARAWAAAISAYDRAAAEPKRLIPATYAKGLAQIELGDLAGARASFGIVNAKVKEGHIGAQVGIAAAMPPADYARRETELLAILGRKDIAKADPRAVAGGWTLAGDDARRAGRLDAARDRYRKALELQPQWIDAIVGDAEIAIVEGRLEAAGTALEQAIANAPDDPAVNLALADLEIRQGNLDSAGARLGKLLEGTPTPIEKARAQMLQGRRLEAADQPDAALAAYAAAQATLGDSDIAPTVAQATLLGTIAQRADQAGKADQAAAARARANQLLGALEDKAKSDPATALTLGRAYLAAGDGARAQTWLEVARAARKDDVEILFQLAEALQKQGKQDAAVEQLRGAFDLDPSRVDVGLELARTYEAAQRRDDARAMYARLLAAPTVTLDTRVRAGLFYARTGDAKQAAAQGVEILKTEPSNAAGMFLKAEGLLVDGQYEEALKLYRAAAKADPQALYHDGVGRAAEKAATALGDTRYRDEALIAYGQAATAEPKMLDAQLGRARLHLERREFQLALEAYKVAQALKPDHPEIPYGVAIAYDELNQDDKLAMQWLTVAAKQRPNAEIAFRLGKRRLNKDSRGAAAAYAQATKLALDDVRVGKPAPRWLTDALWQLGQLQEEVGSARAACDAYQRYLARNPNDDVKVRETKLTRQRLRCP